MIRATYNTDLLPSFLPQASEDKLTKTEKSLKEKEDEARKATGEAKEAQTRVRNPLPAKLSYFNTQPL